MKKYIQSSKHRAMIISAAMGIKPVFSVGKGGISPELTQNISDNIEKHEIVKLSVLKSCTEDIKEMAEMLAERSKSELVQIIGRKIVLYRPAKEEKDRNYEWKLK